MTKQINLTVLSISLLALASCKREITARPEPAAATAVVINPNAIFSGSNDKYAIQSEVTSLLAGQVFAGFKDGAGKDAQFNSPSDVATDANGNIFVADANNNRIRKITTGGLVTTIITTGDALNNPTGIAFGPDGSLYIADQGNNRIRKLVGTTLTTVAGTGVAGFADGPGTTAKFNAPTGIAVDATGIIYVADKGNNRIRRISTTGIVTQWVGDGIAGFKDGTGANAELNQPFSIAIGAGGIAYVADAGNGRIRKIYAGTITTLASGLSLPTGVATDAAGNIFVADAGSNRIKKITATGAITNLVGSGFSSYLDSYDTLAAIEPWGLKIDANGTMYVAERNSEVIRKITPVPATSILAGNGVAGYQEGRRKTAQFKQPWGIVVDKTGNVYVSDYDDNRIRKIAPDGTTGLFAGSGSYAHSDGRGAAASFAHPSGMAIDSTGNLYVYEELHIRKITPAGVVTTIPGQINSYSGEIAFDHAGNLFATSGDTWLYKVTPDQVTTQFGGMPGLLYRIGEDARIIPGSTKHIAAANSNGFYVANDLLDMKYFMDYTGNYTGPIGSQQNPDGTPLYVDFITSMAVASNDRFFVALQSNRIVLTPTPEPPHFIQYLGWPVSGYRNMDGPDPLIILGNVKGMAFGPNGALYFTDADYHNVRVASLPIL